AETLDGIPANMTGEVFSKFDRNYGFVCLNKEQVDGICHNYHVRFLCGKLGMFEAFCSSLPEKLFSISQLLTHVTPL
ncbi:hypothetical protein M9458_016723, partial [Cirrhinus mrigala]